MLEGVQFRLRSKFIIKPPAISRLTRTRIQKKILVFILKIITGEAREDQRSFGAKCEIVRELAELRIGTEAALAA